MNQLGTATPALTRVREAGDALQARVATKKTHLAEPPSSARDQILDFRAASGSPYLRAGRAI